MENIGNHPAKYMANHGFFLGFTFQFLLSVPSTLMLVETNLPTSYLAGFMSIGRMVFIELGLIGDSPPQKQSARTGGELGLQSSLGRDSVRWQTLATH